MENPTRYLKLAGRLYPDNRLILRPAYTTSQPPARVAEHREITAEALTADGTLLGRWPLTARPYSESAATLAIRGTIPLPRDTASIVIWRDSGSAQPIRIGVLDMPETAPEIYWLGEETRPTEGPITVRWGARGNPPPIEYRVHYSIDDGATWVPVSLRLTSTEHTVDLNDLPGGERCRLRVQASNGVRSSETISAPFRVAVKPCVALIQSPLDGADVESPVSLLGNGWHLESNEPELEALHWESDVDGSLGEGAGVLVTMSPGLHTITLTAGTGNDRGQSTIVVNVGGDQPATPT